MSGDFTLVRWRLKLGSLINVYFLANTFQVAAGLTQSRSRSNAILSRISINQVDYQFDKTLQSP
jgi:hypothetical protein